MSGRRMPTTRAELERIAIESKFDLGRMAKSYLVTVRTLERHFALHLKTTPREFVRELQCRLAKPLLAAGIQNKDIAGVLKFADESHFCHVFKKVCQISPKKFGRR
jgi:AraC-like DNA-binding protein